MKTICAECGAHVSGPADAPPPFSHGLCDTCALRTLGSLGRRLCSSELRRGDSVLDRCRRVAHTDGPHEGRCGKWWDEKGGRRILPTALMPVPPKPEGSAP